MGHFRLTLFGWLLIFGDMMTAAFLQISNPLASRSLVFKTSSFILQAVPRIGAASQACKKKKNLLHTEILRDSTIVISPAHSTEDKERLRRRPKVSYTLIRRSLLHYKMRNGDMLVPTKFTVPGECYDWPEEMWGLHLGKIVQSLRAGRRSDKKDDLISIGFRYEASSIHFEIVRKTLLTFKEQNNHLYVPRNFVVPETSDWEECSWGMKLGNIVSNIRTSTSSKSKKYNALKEIGFIFDVRQSRFDLIRRALIHYKEQTGDGEYSLSRGFNVPRTEDWPAEFWDLQLGNAVDNIRRGRYVKYENDLRKIGITSRIKKKMIFE